MIWNLITYTLYLLKLDLLKSVPTRYLPGTYPVPTYYLPGTYPLPTQYLAATYPLPTRYLPLTNSVPTQYLHILKDYTLVGRKHINNDKLLSSK